MVRKQLWKWLCKRKINVRCTISYCSDKIGRDKIQWIFCAGLWYGRKYFDCIIRIWNETSIRNLCRILSNIDCGCRQCEANYVEGKSYSSIAIRDRRVGKISLLVVCCTVFYCCLRNAVLVLYLARNWTISPIRDNSIGIDFSIGR